MTTQYPRVSREQVEDILHDIETDRPNSIPHRTTIEAICRDWLDAQGKLAAAERERDALRESLLVYVNAHGNTKRLDHDLCEVEMFKAFLKATATLGISAELSAATTGQERTNG